MIAIIGILIFLLLPAVQAAREAAREAARQTQCCNHLKQIALAVAHYESAYGRYPMARADKNQHGWIVAILPRLEQQNVADLYQWNFPWTATQNQAAVKTRIPCLLCPSTPNPNRLAVFAPGKEAGVTDYSIPAEVSQTAATKLNLPPGDIPGAIPPYQYGAAAHIRDGLSNTLMLWEVAGRPSHYVKGGRIGPANVVTNCTNADVTNGYVAGGGWADDTCYTPLHGFSLDGTTCAAGQNARCPINCTNNNEAYTFHPNGLPVAFCDGSVRPIHDSISLELTAALITRSGGEVLNHESY